MHRFPCFAALVLVLLAGCQPAAVPKAAVATTLQPAPAGTTSAACQPAPCWGSLPTGLTASCGFVSVPENRSKPDSGSIRLAVMVLRQAGSGPRGEPTFLLGGGPGQDVISLMVALFQDYDKLKTQGYPPPEYEGQLRDRLEFRAAMDLWVGDLAQRPLVLFDQRGAGYSEPSLKCHGEDYEDCYERLVKAGRDLSAYNTLENAADVDDVRRALGFEQINLVGGSYGTRLAYEVLRGYGDHVRAVVLDSVVPPELNWYVDTVREHAHQLDALFAHCETDPACRRSYPDIKADFYGLIEQLDRTPLPVPGGGHFDGGDFLELTWNAMFDVSTIRWLPMLIHDTYRRDYRLLQKLGEVQSAGEPGETTSWGMHYSVECAEEWSNPTRAGMIAAARELPESIASDVLDEFMDMGDVCGVWKVPHVALAGHVQTEVPVLILSGELDSGTPPAFGEVAARGLPHAFRYVFPSMGHTDGFLSHCWTSIQSQFLQDPYRAPDAACIASMSDAVFVVE